MISGERLAGKNERLLDQASLHYIDELGLFFKRFGLSRIAGNVWGLLILAEHPLSIDEIAARLQVSRTAIVTNLQTLQAVAMVQVAPRRGRGDRREYYQIGEDSWENMLKSGDERINLLLGLTKTGLNIIRTDNQEAYKRLKQMEAFFEFWQEWSETFEQAWEKRKTELNLD